MNGAFLKVKFRALFICAFLGWIVSLLDGMADSVIAGLFLDCDAVSAVGLISPVSSFMFFMSTLISIGCAMVYSRTLGAFDIEKSQKIAGTGLITSLCISVFLLLVMLPGKKLLLAFYGVTDQIYSYASEYFNPYIAIACIYPILWLLYYLVSYDGDNGIVLIADLAMAVSNAVFSVVLVQRIGVAGLGYGTLVSTVLGLLIILIHFLKKNNSIHFKFKFLPGELKEMFILSSSSSLTTLYSGIAGMVFNKIVIMQFGEVYLTAYAVSTIVVQFAAVLVCGITAGAVFVTVAYGENNPYAIKRTMKLTVLYSLVLAAILTIVVEFLAPFWPNLYAITDPAVFKAAVFAGRVIPATYIFTAIVYTFMLYYPAVDKAAEGNILSIGYMLAGPMLLALPLSFTGSFYIMSIGFALTPVFALVAAAVYTLVKKESGNLPYLIKASDEKEFHYDIELETESIIKLRDKAGEFLKCEGVDNTRIREIELIIEDMLVFIMNRNKSDNEKKKVICECTLLVNDNRIRLITKDNGIIFDITKEAEDAVDLRAFILASVMETASERSNTTTISFNRNTCVWDRA